MRMMIFAVVLLFAAAAKATTGDYYALVDSAEFYIGAHEWEKAERFIQSALRNEPDNQNTSLLLSNLTTVLSRLSPLIVRLFLFLMKTGSS